MASGCFWRQSGVGRSIAERSGQETAEKFPRDRPGARKLSSNPLYPPRLRPESSRSWFPRASFSPPFARGSRVARFRRLSGAFRGKSLENQPQPPERAATNSCGRLGFSPSRALSGRPLGPSRCPPSGRRQRGLKYRRHPATSE